MRIISLHINNYGKLSNFDYAFNDNITTFCEDNGFGKTTIVSFIKAMFYGLETVKSNTSKFSDRKHFYPFSGGVFGGNILIEFDKKEYRIERIFDEKSEIKDSLTVYLNGNKTVDLGDVPGLKIFGINKESFERLLSINADKIEVETDSDINKKLNNYMENVSEDFDIDVVIKRIKDSKKLNKNNLDKLKEDTKTLDDEIRNLETIKESLDSKYKDLNDFDKAKNDAKILYDKVSLESIEIEKWNSYDRIVKETNQKEKEINEIQVRYPNGLPTKEEIKHVKDLNFSIDKKENLLHDSNISSDDLNEYKRITDKYNNYYPSEDEILKLEEEIREFSNLTSEIENIEKEEKSYKEKDLDRHFFGEEVKGEVLANLEKEFDLYLKMEDELKQIKPTLIINENHVEEVKKPLNKNLYIGLLILSLVLVGLGIGLLFSVKILGVILLVAGGILLFLDMFMYFSNSLKHITNKIQVSKEIPNPEYEKLNKVIESKNNQILNILANYRYNGDRPSLLFVQFKNDVAAYSEILENKKERNERLITLKERKNELNHLLEHFFKEINMPDIAYKTALETLKKELERFQTLKGIINKSSVKKDDLEKEIKELKNKVESFYDKYLLPIYMPIENVSRDFDNYERLKNEYQNKRSEAENYLLSNNLIERPIGNSYSIEELNNDYNQKLSLFNSLKQEILDMEERVSSLDDKKMVSLSNKERRKELENKAKLFDSLVDEINKADQSLKDKYVAPIKDKFLEYAKALEETIGEKVYMDKDYKISFDREGSLRSYEHLSSGMLTICALCFRLALIDNMFIEELPFIIMDDPFTNLDNAHLQKTKDLLSKISSNKQILYFCCHESRKM